MDESTSPDPAGAPPPADPAGAPPPPPARAGAEQDHRKLITARERDALGRLLAALAKVLGIVVTLVTLTGGAVTLLFQVDPTLEPCVGASGVTFTSAQVIPDYPLTQYYTDITGNPNVPDSINSSEIGAEVRYAYTTSNLSGNGLVLRGTLQEIGADGSIVTPTLAPTEFTNVDNLVPQVTAEQLVKNTHEIPSISKRPDQCSEDANGIYFIELPPDLPRHHRYRVLLELYRGRTLENRVGVGVTPVFEH